MLFLRKSNIPVRCPKRIFGLQNVPWPFGQMTRQEMYERREEMSTAVPTLVQQLTGNPRPGQEKREL